MPRPRTWPGRARISCNGCRTRTRVRTEDGWQGRIFQAAARNTPFALHLSPEEIFRSPGWQRSLRAALAAIAEGRHVVVLGETGVGKSTFLADLDRTLARAGHRAAHCHAAADAPSDLDFNVALLDDAGEARPELLASLLGCGRPLVMACRPRARLLLEAAASLPEIIRLEPLSATEAAALLARRLVRAGRPAQWLAVEAAFGLAQYSGGILRNLLLLAGAAAFLADLECRQELGLSHVQQAAAIAEPGGAQMRLPAPAPAPISTASDRPTISRARRSFGAGSLIGSRVAASLACGLAVLALVWAAPSVTGGWNRPRPDMIAALEAPHAPITLERAEISPPPPPDASLAPPVVAAEAPASVAEPRLQTEAARAADPTPIALAAPAEDDLLATARSPELQTIEPQTTEPPSSVVLATAGLAEGVDGQVLLGSFKGQVNNETLRLSGKLSLEIIRDGAPGAVRARFHAWRGLLGTGELSGTLSPDGRIVLSGQLLMGRNPFLCDLTGEIKGDRVTGSARFVRPWGGTIALSNFDLLRS